MRNRYHERMNAAREHLGGKCVKCGITTELEMDHIDPETKLFAISDGYNTPLPVFWAEVAKCQLLCRQHHREKTQAESSVAHGGGASGRKNCKCDPCKARKAEYMREYKARRKLVAA